MSHSLPSLSIDAGGSITGAEGAAIEGTYVNGGRELCTVLGNVETLFSASFTGSIYAGATYCFSYASLDTASHVLKKYEDEFFRVTNAKIKLLELKRKEVISEDLVMEIESADHEKARELLFEHLHRHANMAKLREYCTIAISADGFPKMQRLGEKMLHNLPPEGLLGLVCGWVGGWM